MEQVEVDECGGQAEHGDQDEGGEEAALEVQSRLNGAAGADLQAKRKYF